MNYITGLFGKGSLGEKLSLGTVGGASAWYAGRMLAIHTPGMINGAIGWIGQKALGNVGYYAGTLIVSPIVTPTIAPLVTAAGAAVTGLGTVALCKAAYKMCFGAQKEETPAEGAESTEGAEAVEDIVDSFKEVNVREETVEELVDSFEIMEDRKESSPLQSRVGTDSFFMGAGLEGSVFA